MFEKYQGFELWCNENCVCVEIYDAEEITNEEIDGLESFFEREFERLPLSELGIEFRIIIHQLNERIKDCTFFSEIDGKITLLRGASYSRSLTAIYGLLVNVMSYFHELIKTKDVVNLTSEEIKILKGIKQEFEPIDADKIIDEMMEEIKINNAIEDIIKDFEDEAE